MGIEESKLQIIRPVVMCCQEGDLGKIVWVQILGVRLLTAGSAHWSWMASLEAVLSVRCSSFNPEISFFTHSVDAVSALLRYI